MSGWTGTQRTPWCSRVPSRRGRRSRRVVYPGLASHPQAAVARRQLRNGGGLMAVDLGDRAIAAAFIDTLTIPPRTASLGSIQTLVVHPPSSTHRQLDDAELAATGIAPGHGARVGGPRGRRGPAWPTSRPRWTCGGPAATAPGPRSDHERDPTTSPPRDPPIATTSPDRDPSSTPLDLLARVGRAAWATLTSVRFAVMLITTIVVSGRRRAPWCASSRRPCSTTRRAMRASSPTCTRAGTATRSWASRIGPAMVDLFDDWASSGSSPACWFVAAAGGPGRGHRLLHPRPDAAAVALGPAGHGRPAAAVLRPAAARAGTCWSGP